MSQARARARQRGRARWWSRRRRQDVIAKVIWAVIALVWLLMGLERLGVHITIGG